MPKVVYTVTNSETGAAMPSAAVMIYAYGRSDSYTSDSEGKITLDNLQCGVSLKCVGFVFVDNKNIYWQEEVHFKSATTNWSFFRWKTP